METKTKFIRSFFIFSPQDKDSGVGPSGYVRLEVKDGKGRLQANVQSLKGNGDIEYRLYMVKSSDGQTIPVLAGILKLEKNRASLEKEFEPADFDSTGVRAEDLNGAVVLAQSKGSRSGEFTCPLAACKNMRENWREQLTEYLYSKDKTASSINEITSRYDFEIESKIPVDKDTFTDAVQRFDENIEPLLQKEEYIAQSATDSFLRKPILDELPEEKMEREVANPGLPPATNGSGGPAVPFPLCVEGGCNHSCAVCNVYMSRRPPVEQPLKINVLKRYLNNYFEVYNPFKHKRKDYEWWKVDSPVNLNNILFQFGIREPQLFNPLVLSAYFKYRHLVAGLYTDHMQRKECLVFGVPGIYGIDPNPLENNGLWVQVEGHGAKYGAFGYWLVYMELKKLY